MLEFIILHVFNANSVHPDQMPGSAVSDLSLHCLPMSLLWRLGINGLKKQQQKMNILLLAGGTLSM